MRAQNVLGKINLNTTVDRQKDVTQLHLKTVNKHFVYIYFLTNRPTTMYVLYK